MKTHNAAIYHCPTCGRVEHAELTAQPPQCCGHPMLKAAEETIPNGNATGTEARNLPGTVPPVTKRDQKPK